MSNRLALVAALLLIGVAQFTMASQDDTTAWSEWKAKHNKVYETPEEDARRFAVFQDNKKRIDEHNAKFDKGEVSYFMGLNPFSDLTSEEFRLRNGHRLVSLPADKQWEEWKATHNKQYESAAEEGRRYSVFLDNKKHVEEHNAKFNKGEVSYALGLNAFSDLTNDEFKQRNGHGLRQKRAVMNVDAIAVRDWAEWKAKHNKVYATPEEEARRFTIFQDNKKQVDEHNAKFDKGEVTYSKGLNAFSDLTAEEFKQRNGHGLRQKRAVMDVDAILRQQWTQWKAEHNKVYGTPEEETLRFAAFQDNKKYIDEHNEKFNKGEVSYTLGLNVFSDLTNEEFKQKHASGLRVRERRTVDAAVIQQWAEWKAKHNKVYESPEEEARRFTVFQDNKKRIDEHNEKFSKGEVTFSTGLNAFSDLTAEELKQRNGHGVQKKDDAAKALQQQWEEWKAEHKRQYETPEEEARRFVLFQDNKKRIDEHNEKFKRGEVSFSMGLNSFADLTSEEVKQRFGRGVLPRRDH
ncbi:uncharacterized protein LOC117654060 isoform X2 [Thrips palmi]|uniref:Uncharacterized protein LOC117654060 isoform X2 n=1 Tax=Thrips palmi TaxID=161013 RepID=A0A6P9ACY7_THRPL|nr:uncharacterized protein LOC117654060 isoform X2 [Thrips palmi]